MTTQRTLFGIVALCCVTAIASARAAESNSISSPPPRAKCSCCTAAPDDAGKRYALRGIVEKLLPEDQALLVKHEEIPGFMPAMTMMFQIDPELLPPVKVGDTITAEMRRSESGRWLLDNVKIIDS